MSATPKITFVGGGNMGAALIAGLVASGVPGQTISVGDPNSDVRQSLTEQFGVQVFESGADACLNADLVVLAVKPQIARAVAAQINGSIASKPSAVVSIVAGISIATLNAWLGKRVPIARAMPNTPALIGCGITGIFTGALPDSTRHLIGSVFSAVGEVVWLDNEGQIHAVTALSGSGPAYFFRMVEALQEAGVGIGLTPQDAARLASHTALGAGRLLAESGDNASTLRRKVTSPNGTTESGLQALEHAGINEIMATVVRAAHDRSIELGQDTDG